MWFGLSACHDIQINRQTPNSHFLPNNTTGYWQQELPKLGTFTAVFMDDFPLPLDHASGGSAEDGAKERRQAQRDERRIMAAVGSRWHAFLDLVLRCVFALCKLILS